MQARQTCSHHISGPWHHISHSVLHFSLRFTFLTLFYISLGKATVPVRINIIISLGRRVFLEGCFFFFSLWRSVCSSPPFLVVLATAIKLKLQEVEGLPCLLLRRRRAVDSDTDWLVVSTGWQHYFEWGRGSLNPSLLCPPTHPIPIIKFLPTSRLTTVFISSVHWALLSYLRVHSGCLSDDYSICLFILLVTCQAHLELDLSTGLLQGQVFNQRSHPSHSRIVLFFW